MLFQDLLNLVKLEKWWEVQDNWKMLYLQAKIHTGCGFDYNNMNKHISWQKTVTQSHKNTVSQNYCDKNCDDGLNPIYKKSISLKNKQKRRKNEKITFTILKITSSPNSCVTTRFFEMLWKFVTSNFVPFWWRRRERKK